MIVFLKLQAVFFILPPLDEASHRKKTNRTIGGAGGVSKMGLDLYITRETRQYSSRAGRRYTVDV